MNLENIYNSNKDSIIGFNHDNFNNYRKKLIDNFNLDNKILKNNDSTKFFDNKILKNLKYSFNNSKESFEFISSKNKDNKKSIIINNGNQYKLNNLNSENMEIFSFQNKQDEIMKKILEYMTIFLSVLVYFQCSKLRYFDLSNISIYQYY